MIYRCMNVCVLIFPSVYLVYKTHFRRLLFLLCFVILQVIHVSNVKLLADVKVLAPVKENVEENDLKIIEQVKNTEVRMLWFMC